MSLSFFNKLNYTLANEDTGMELAMLPDDLPHVMAVCGSGARVLPLLAKRPRQLSVVDLSQEQLWLAELRIAALREFDCEAYAAFWGYPPSPLSPQGRRAKFESLALSNGARIFFTNLFEENAWGHLLYDGKWERTFGKMAHMARLFTGDKGLGLFDCKTLAEQERYLVSSFPTRRWHAAVAVMGNAKVFNALLYKGHFVSKNLPESHFTFYRQAFERLFALGPARENFFLQVVFFGEVRYPEGMPAECMPEVYDAAKRGLAGCELRFLRGNVFEQAAQAATPIDFLSLSDVPSYFSGRTEQEFMQRLRPSLAPGALVVVRSYLHVPWRPDLAGFENLTSAFGQAISTEKTQMYLVDVYRKNS